MKFLTICLFMFSLPALGQNVQCQKRTEEAFMKLFFCPCPSRVVANFRVDAGGEFSEGQRVPVKIDGKTVGRMTIATSGDQLVGRFSKGRTGATAKVGSMAEIGGLRCRLR